MCTGGRGGDGPLIHRQLHARVVDDGPDAPGGAGEPPLTLLCLPPAQPDTTSWALFVHRQVLLSNKPDKNLQHS